MQSEADSALVSQARAGDSEAFGRLVERHQGRVYAVCLRIVGDPEDARDAAQDAFVTAFRKLAQFRGDAAFSTWLHRIAVNSCYDTLRKRRRGPLLARAIGDDENLTPDPAEPDISDRVVDAVDVERALGLVPEDFRVALVLADVEQIPYDEIARILEVAIGTVKSRVHRGRLALARAMNQSHREPPGGVRASEEDR